MKFPHKNISNLHLKSTLAELNLSEAKFDIKTKAIVIRKYLHNNPEIPGVIITDKDKLIDSISRNTFFEHFSKPFGTELYSKRNMEFFLESYDTKDSLLVIPSNEEIVKALQIKLNSPNHSLENPIVVKFEYDGYKILDSYQLILAQTHISSLAMNSLKEANEVKSDMLNIAAHDLKNPLNAIIGWAKVLKGLLIDFDADTLEMVQHIQTSAEQMFSLIIELLNSTVIESGKIQLKKQFFDISELVSAIVYQNKDLAEKKEQILDFSRNWDDDYYIDGDSLKIRETIDNLVNNAIKFSPYNSKINIELFKNADTIRFKVKDQGPGLNEEDLQKIFGKFQRLSAQPTGGENSTGLGLYIAKQIVDLHNGKIWVESKASEGAAFIIEFPALEI